MDHRLWNIYLSGEIHSDWRSEIESQCEKQNIPVRLMGPETNHKDSDNCGESTLGSEQSNFWKDHKAAKINTIRNRGVIKNCDIMVVRFGEEYRQWNAAFDAGFASSRDISIITLHDESLDHALKEIDAIALATARTTKQVTDILNYITRKPF